MSTPLLDRPPAPLHPRTYAVPATRPLPTTYVARRRRRIAVALAVRARTG